MILWLESTMRSINKWNVAYISSDEYKLAFDEGTFVRKTTSDVEPGHLTQQALKLTYPSIQIRALGIFF